MYKSKHFLVVFCMFLTISSTVRGMESELESLISNPPHLITRDTFNENKREFIEFVEDHDYLGFELNWKLLELFLSTARIFNIVKEYSKEEQRFMEYFADKNAQKRRQAINNLGNNELNFELINILLKAKKKCTGSFFYEANIKSDDYLLAKMLSKYLEIPHSTSLVEARNKLLSSSQEKQFAWTTIELFSFFLFRKYKKQQEKIEALKSNKVKQD